MKKLNIYLKIFLDFIFLCVFFWFGIKILPWLVYFFMPFVIGWFISYAANPIVRFLEKRVKIVRRHGSAIIIVLALIVVVLILYLAVTGIIRQIIDIANNVPEIFTTIDTRIEEITDRYNYVYRKLPSFVQEYIDEFRESLRKSNDTSILSDYGASFAQNAVRNLISAMIFILFTVLSAYFFTAEKITLENRLKIETPEYIKKYIDMVSDNFKTAVGGYFKAQFKIMFVMIAILYISLMILGIKYSFLAAVIIGFLDFLPVFGTGIILIPWAIYRILIQDYFAGIGLLVLYALCQVVKQVLQPKMVGKSIGIGSFTTLFLLYLGYKIGGILGIIIAIPAGMILINLYKAGMFRTYQNDLKYVVSNISVFRRENADEIATILKKRKKIDSGE